MPLHSIIIMAEIKIKQVTSSARIEVKQLEIYTPDNNGKW